MKTTLLAGCLITLIIPIMSTAQDEPFSLRVLNQAPAIPANRYKLMHPFDIVYGADNFLYITEKPGRISRVDTGTGIRKIILDIQHVVYLNISRTSGSGATDVKQNGMLGMVLHPGFSRVPGKDSIYVAYSYSSTSLRISRFHYNAATQTCGNETVLLQGIPANVDHSSGRLIIGGDNCLYYSCGDQGSNQFGNKCKEILSQELPTAAQMQNNDYSNYAGKLLRIGMDGSIPADNPVWGGIRSHIFTIGHRNPQGLVWQKEGAGTGPFPLLKSNGILYSSEHGPNTDDEINIIEGGKNYGWPYIAGDTDNINYQYVRWFEASNCSSIGYVENSAYVPGGATVTSEKNAPAHVKDNFRKPIRAVYTGCGSNPVQQCDVANGYLKFPTIAPSSIEYYELNMGAAIPGWYPSLLVTTLKKGTVYRYKLDPTGTTIISDSIPYFKSYNRYRDIALSPDGKIFLITDSIGSTSGPSSHNPSTLDHRGAILVYKYTGSVLSLPEPENPNRPEQKFSIRLYPNPASSQLSIAMTKVKHLPVQYQLHDLAGRIVLSGSISKDRHSIAVSQIPRGVYVLRLSDANGTELRREKIMLQ